MINVDNKDLESHVTVGWFPKAWATPHLPVLLAKQTWLIGPSWKANFWSVGKEQVTENEALQQAS